MWNGKLKVSQEVYESRLKTLDKFMEIGAPMCIIHMGARMLAESFEYTWKDRWERWLFTKAPKWVAWVCDADYRQACKEYLIGDDDEDEDSSNS